MPVMRRNSKRWVCGHAFGRCRAAFLRCISDGNLDDFGEGVTPKEHAPTDSPLVLARKGTTRKNRALHMDCGRRHRGILVARSLRL